MKYTMLVLLSQYNWTLAYLWNLVWVSFIILFWTCISSK